jgi:hypothetical protein
VRTKYRIVGQYFERVNEANQDTVNASLLVECKNTAQPSRSSCKLPRLANSLKPASIAGGFPSFTTDSETHVRIPLHRAVHIDLVTEGS